MTALGAALVVFFKNAGSGKLKSIFCGFASGVMLAASVWSLLIPSMEYAEKVKHDQKDYLAKQGIHALY